jgi:carboxylesterase type B
LFVLIWKFDFKDERRRSVPTAMKPVIEIEHDDAFLTRKPLEIIKGDKLTIPMIIGVNNHEGTGPTSAYQNKLEHYSNDMIRTIPRSLKIDPHSGSAKNLAIEIGNFYFGQNGLTSETFPKLVQLIGDVYFTNYSIMTMELYQKFQPGCLQFAYEFCLDNKINLMKQLVKMDYLKGAGHFDEISFLFE